MKNKMPKEILVYACDYVDGKPVHAVATDVNEIPEDCNGEKVGLYVLEMTSTLKVKRELL